MEFVFTGMGQKAKEEVVGTRLGWLKFYYQIRGETFVPLFTDNIAVLINFLTISLIPLTISVVKIMIYISNGRFQRRLDKIGKLLI